MTAASSSVPLMPSKTLMASARVAGAARDLDLEPAAGIRDGVAPEIDGVENRVALAVALQVGRDDRGLAVLRADRADEGRVVGRLAGDLRRRAAAARGQAALLPGLRRRLAALGRRTLGGTARLAAGRRGRAVRDHAREALRRHLRDVLADLGEIRRGQPGLALVDDDRRRELAALKVLGRGERVRRLGVTRQERGGLVVLSVRELGRQLCRTGSDEDPDQPDQEHDPLGSTAGGDSEDRTARVHLDTVTRSRSSMPFAPIL